MAGRFLGTRAWQCAVAGALVVALGGTACGGGGGDDKLTVHEFEPVASSWLPSQILDLTVAEEHPSTPLQEGDEPYIDELGVFSLRRGELLQATLQVSHFADQDRIANGAFQRRLVAGVAGTTSPSLIRVGEQRVYLTSGGRQTVAVWFDSAYMLVASIREEYARPRALLRALTELEAGA
jgi:hypothetical protein